MIKKIKKYDNSKPLFYCPRHKTHDMYIIFADENIIPCNLESCFCGNLNGWIALCQKCNCLVHNCIHGCEEGLILNNILIKNEIIMERTNKILYEHMTIYHKNKAVYLYYVKE